MLVYLPIILLNTRIITFLIVFFLIVLGSYFYNKSYTVVTFISLAIALLVIQFLNYKWIPRLYLSLIVLILPFLIVNGILTGTGLTEEVVWYNNDELIGLRVFTVPIEDFFYGFLLILLNVLSLELLKKKNTQPA